MAGLIAAQNIYGEGDVRGDGCDIRDVISERAGHRRLNETSSVTMRRHSTVGVVLQIILQESKYVQRIVTSEVWL